MHLAGKAGWIHVDSCAWLTAAPPGEVEVRSCNCSLCAEGLIGLQLCQMPLMKITNTVPPPYSDSESESQTETESESEPKREPLTSGTWHENATLI